MNNKNSVLTFDKYIFGYSDAETEYTRSPKIFEEAFYDPKNIVNKLIHGHEFMLIGRKGVGKTAFSAKIRNLAKFEENLFAEQISLSNFEFDSFYSMGNANLEGTQKFKTVWDLTLIIQIFRMLNRNFDFSEIEQFNKVIDFLQKNGLLHGKNINATVRNLSKRSFDFNLKMFKFTSEYDFKENIYANTELIENLLDTLQNLYYNNNKIRIIVDGLDDILRYTQDNLSILAGLIRSINEINLTLSNYEIPIKIILLAREDILSNITDPDFNKIRRDGGIVLNWNNKTDDLKNLVNLRFKLSGVPDSSIRNYWNLLFPSVIKNKGSWSYITEFTLSKPRDILQFLSQCQNTFPNKTRLSYSELDTVLVDYSNEYFLDEMKNELSGFFEDNTINFVPQIMQKIGGSDFSYSEFKAVAKSLIGIEEDSYYRRLTLTLFENSYIGQVTEISTYDKYRKKNITKKQAIFKHKKSTLKINYDYKFSLHKGFYKALNIKK